MLSADGADPSVLAMAARARGVHTVASGESGFFGFVVECDELPQPEIATRVARAQRAAISRLGREKTARTLPSGLA